MESDFIRQMTILFTHLGYNKRWKAMTEILWSIWIDSSSPLVTNVCSSATKEVVMFRRGTLNNLDTRLNTEAETPTAANSTDPTITKI